MAEGPQGAAGRRLGGRYRLLWPLGSGGAATVWAARDELLGVDRAVKLLTVEPGERAEALRQRLRVEARTMAGLRHPHILRVLDLGEDGAQDFVVMDLAPRGALSARLAAEGPLPLPELLKVGAQLCGALAAAHAAGVVHRDVKPQNLLLNAEGDVQLADFGIALLAGDAALRLTRAGVAMGSLAYMAPEQRLDAAGVGPAADIYAAGATLYALATNENPIDLFLAGPGAPRWLAVPPALRPSLLRATRLDPAERHPSAAALGAELAALGPVRAVEGPGAWLSGLGAGLAQTDVSGDGLAELTPPAWARTAGAEEGRWRGAATRTDVEQPIPDGGSGALPTTAAAASTAGGGLRWLDPGAALGWAVADPETTSTAPWSAPTDGGVASARGGEERPADLGSSAPGDIGSSAPEVHPEAELRRPPLGLRLGVGALGLAGLVGLALLLRGDGEEEGAPKTTSPAVIAPTSEEPLPAPAAVPAPAPAPAPAPEASPAPAPAEAPPRPAARPAVRAAVDARAPAGEGEPRAGSSGGGPMGSWLLSFGGRQAELRLRRGGPGLRGELTVRQGQRAVRNVVEGEYSAETRSLRLRDTEAVPDAGRYELQLSADGLRIEGRFVREDTGDITRLRGWRPE